MGGALEVLRPRLAAMAEAEVLRPAMPIAIYHQEVHDLVAWLRGEGRWARLEAVGLRASPAALEEALEASREAQAGWGAVRSARKPGEQLEVEERAAALRAEVTQALRWNLRESRVAMGALDRIAEGQGTADLVQDLDELAALVEANAEAFAADRTFDPAARAAEARRVATDVRVGLSEYRTDERMREALSLRDRAWTHLEGLVADVRAAGRYAFRGTADMTRFGSAYERRQRASQRDTARPTEPTA